ncbi:MAG TPA: aminotransferase class V-fold PLP-dependent enzyme [Mycobacteriales bacterium]|nr:aminotransferase class V-fold PLP-dependent enzyme [Mycobacteriales bacterium]
MAEVASEQKRAPRLAAPSAAALRDAFLLDPNWTYLNHGAFGACPRPVFETYQRLQLELERQPVELLERTYPARMDAARERLAGIVGADPEGLVFVPNTTTGVNTVARAIDLRPGDEVLLTDHEHGGCRLAWQAATAARGATVVTAALPLPFTDPAGVLAALEAARTPRTRVVFVSHLAAETAAVLPVSEVCRWAREHGVLSVVDGAHAPGQLPLHVTAIDPDAYVGNCHKWLCAPKATGFLWVRETLRDDVPPLVVTWGCVPGASFVQRHSWTGTHDPAAALAVPAAIAFAERHNWPVIRARGHALAARLGAELSERYGEPALYPPGTSWHGQMVSASVPWVGDPKILQRRLREEHRIEVPVHRWRDRVLVRASFGPYNDSNDLARLLDALGRLI